ncbi:unnamed protein product [Caenorhabditis sp. 36 PRJEB53466]|nr:unnamed protein product [Caenorhabditis sp. 36 PRJEB53466]
MPAKKPKTGVCSESSPDVMKTSAITSHKKKKNKALKKNGASKKSKKRSDGNKTKQNSSLADKNLRKNFEKLCERIEKQLIEVIKKQKGISESLEIVDSLVDVIGDAIKQQYESRRNAAENSEQVPEQSEESSRPDIQKLEPKTESSNTTAQNLEQSSRETDQKPERTNAIDGPSCGACGSPSHRLGNCDKFETAEARIEQYWRIGKCSHCDEIHNPREVCRFPKRQCHYCPGDHLPGLCIRRYGDDEDQEEYSDEEEEFEEPREKRHRTNFPGCQNPRHRPQTGTSDPQQFLQRASNFMTDFQQQAHVPLHAPASSQALALFQAPAHSQMPVLFHAPAPYQTATPRHAYTSYQSHTSYHCHTSYQSYTSYVAYPPAPVYPPVQAYPVVHAYPTVHAYSVFHACPHY